MDLLIFFLNEKKVLTLLFKDEDIKITFCRQFIPLHGIAFSYINVLYEEGLSVCYHLDVFSIHDFLSPDPILPSLYLRKLPVIFHQIRLKFTCCLASPSRTKLFLINKFRYVRYVQCTKKTEHSVHNTNASGKVSIKRAEFFRTVPGHPLPLPRGGGTVYPASTGHTKSRL